MPAHIPATYPAAVGCAELRLADFTLDGIRFPACRKDLAVQITTGAFDL